MSGNKRRKKRILVVDDDELIRELLEKTLANAGFRVSSVPNGLKLIACLEVARPDLILLDIHMSWIDGFELCRLISQMPEYKTVPIVFISGRYDEATIKQGQNSGAVDFIPKPFDLLDLIRRVKIHLRLDQQPEARAVNAD